MRHSGPKPISEIISPICNLHKTSLTANGTVQDRVYRALKQSILNGDFVPGHSVTIRGLAAELGVSAMPVREALRRLSAERALTFSATGRVSIPVMTPQKLKDLVTARICLEKQAATDALPRMNKRSISSLVKINEIIDQSIAKGNHREYLIRHREFHFNIYRNGGDVFLPLIESVWLQFSPFLRYTLSLAHLAKYSVQDRHVEIIEAVKEADATKLGEAIEADIRQGLGSLTEADWSTINDRSHSVGP